MIFVVVRGEKSFKEWSGVQLDGVGRSQERSKRISSWQNQKLFCCGIWVADFPFNQRLIQLYLYNHHQEFLQLQLVCYFHLRGKKNNNFKLQKSAVCGVIPPNETTVIMAALCSNFILSYKQNCCHTVIMLLHQTNLRAKILSILKRMNHSTFLPEACRLYSVKR